MFRQHGADCVPQCAAPRRGTGGRGHAHATVGVAELSNDANSEHPIVPTHD